jgi:hypothetical protein
MNCLPLALGIGLPLTWIAVILTLVVLGELRRRQRTETDDDNWR